LIFVGFTLKLLKQIKMKALKLNLKNLALVALVSVAVFATSCNKDDYFSPEQSSSFDDAELKKGKAVKPSSVTIADIVVASATNEEEPQFTLLLAALEYTGLTSVFTGGEQYTVFAPTDEAFGNLVTAVAGLLDPDILENDGPFAAIDALLGEGTVTNVLLYHVAEGRRAANSVVPPVRPRTIETLLGVSFTVDSKGMITAVGNTAGIVKADISASNGIIHVIDTVILPISLD
jgi:uncharacterized surface protein with fasciclin (FAS1) repeats